MIRTELLGKSKRANVIGQMDNTKDHTFESANRIYDKKCSCPTIPTCGGGGIQPKVIKKWSEKTQELVQ